MNYLDSEVEYSNDKQYRYSLKRVWDRKKPTCCFVISSPCSSDEKNDKQFVKKAVQYANDWGYGSLYIVSLWPVLVPDRKTPISQIIESDSFDWGSMRTNSHYISFAINHSDLIILAWGDKGNYKDRDKDFLTMYNDGNMKCLGYTKKGNPIYPLYQDADIKPIIFREKK